MHRVLTRSTVVGVVALGVLTLATPSGADSILTCTFTNGTAVFEMDESRSIRASLNTKERPWTVVFAALDSDRPRLKAKAGEENLLVLRRTPRIVWLLETPPLGGFNVWTVFLDQRIVTLSKQYDLVGAFSMLSMGRCR